MTWAQNHAPLGNVGLSALVAALPVVMLLGLPAFCLGRAHLAALAGLAVAALIAIEDQASRRTKYWLVQTTNGYSYGYSRPVTGPAVSASY